MAKPLDEQFFEWLYSQVADQVTENPEQTYTKLFRQMYRTEFYAVVARDNNRIKDTEDLYHEFVARKRIRGAGVKEWMETGCSVLELLVTLARKASFIGNEEGAQYWFWEMIKNLGLGHLNDAAYRNSDDYVSEILERFIERKYEPSGRGGLFPLEHTNEDQRKVELWYQLNAYVQERDT